MPNKKESTYKSAAELLGDVQNLMDVFLDSKRYTPAAKKLTSKILAEWAKDIRTRAKKAKSPMKRELKTALLLECYAKFLV